MMHYSAVGDPQTVEEYLDDFAEHADADELIVVHSSPTIETRLHSLDLVADVEQPHARVTRRLSDPRGIEQHPRNGGRCREGVGPAACGTSAQDCEEVNHRRWKAGGDPSGRISTRANVWL